MPDRSDPAAEELLGAFTRASAGPAQEESIRRFGHFGCRPVEAAGLHTGAHVLDVATGRGVALFPAADNVQAREPIVIIVYEPDPSRWDSTFTQRNPGSQP